MLIITWELVLCPICMPKGHRPEGLTYISDKALVPNTAYVITNINRIYFIPLNHIYTEGVCICMHTYALFISIPLNHASKDVACLYLWDISYILSKPLIFVNTINGRSFITCRRTKK